MDMQAAYDSEHPVPSEEREIRALYRQLMKGWNERSSTIMSEPFAEDGELIGFDGSQLEGRSALALHLQQVFADHPTPPYVVKVKKVSILGTDAAILRAIAGMVPPGKTELEPKLNAHHTVVARKQAGRWVVALFQNTPAQFHGRPELVKQMTEELRQSLS